MRLVLPVPDAVRGVLRGYDEHDLLTFASAIAFQVLSAIVPFTLFVVALLGLAWCVARWAGADFGPLGDQRILRVLTLSFTGLAAAFQFGLVAFLASLMEIPQRAGATRANRPADTGTR
jgi:hypothetical protein